jgi:hypothetical protein
VSTARRALKPPRLAEDFVSNDQGSLERISKQLENYSPALSSNRRNDEMVSTGRKSAPTGGKMRSVMMKTSVKKNMDQFDQFQRTAEIKQIKENLIRLEAE